MSDATENRETGTEEETLVFDAVWKGYDSAEGEMLEELLRQEGFTARLIGTRTAALIGVGQFSTELRIEVPADRADEARKLLEQFQKAPSDMQEEKEEAEND